MEVKRFHLVDWRIACSPIWVPGLCIRELCTFNHSLLGNGSMLWRRIIYGEEWGCWILNSVRITHGVGAWKGLEPVRSFSRFVGFQIGDARRVTFGMIFGMLTSC